MVIQLASVIERRMARWRIAHKKKHDSGLQHKAMEIVQNGCPIYTRKLVFFVFLKISQWKKATFEDNVCRA